jgi:cell division inhibitor SulA/protein ImuA
MPSVAVLPFSLPFSQGRRAADAPASDPLPDALAAGGLDGVLARGDVWRGDRLAGGPAARPSGFPALDAELPGGGWPGGALVDLMHARPGIGELALLLPAIAAATAADEWAFLLAPPYRVFALAWQAAGVRLSRLVVLDPAEAGAPRCAGDALWAAEQVLRAGSAAVALLWLPRTTTAEQVRRLQVAAEAGGCTGFFLQDEARLAQPSAAPLRLRLAAHHPAGRLPFASDALDVQVVKRRGAPLAQPVVLSLRGGVGGGGAMAPAACLDGDADFSERMGAGRPTSDALACAGLSAAAA